MLQEFYREEESRDNHMDDEHSVCCIAYSCVTYCVISKKQPHKACAWFLTEKKETITRAKQRTKTHETI